MIDRLAERMGWWFIPASLLFWTVLWPLAVPVIAAVAIRRALALDHAPAARRERRVARLLRWYPAAWRERHGDEFAALLHDTIDDGRGGLRMSVNVAFEGLVRRVDAFDRPAAVATWCWTGCWIPLVPQGLVPMVMLVTGAPTRSWFLALYVPEPFGWAVAATMTAAGLAMLAIAIRLTRRLRAPAQDLAGC